MRLIECHLLTLAHQILKKRAALLSNLEVLTHFRTLHAENTLITSSVAAERARRDRQKADFDTYGFGKDGKVDLKGKGRMNGGTHYDDHGMELELKTPEEEQREREMAIRGVSEDTVFVTEQVRDRSLCFRERAPLTRPCSSSNTCLRPASHRLRDNHRAP